MPQIFDEEGREKVRLQLLEHGFDLIKMYGLKKTSISDITERAGIATGTFYNFFKTKEEFVYQIVVYKRMQSKAMLVELTKKGKIGRKAFRQYLLSLYTSDNNIFEFLSESEISQLKARWPKEYWISSSNDQATVSHILEMVKNPNPNCDWKVLGNMFKAMALIGHARKQLYPDEYEETIERFSDCIVRYVFDK